MTSRKRAILLAAVWLGALAAGSAWWLFPPFARIVHEELLPIGWVTGWLAHGGWLRSRARRTGGEE